MICSSPGVVGLAGGGLVMAALAWPLLVECLWAGVAGAEIEHRRASVAVRGITPRPFLSFMGSSKLTGMLSLCGYFG